MDVSDDILKEAAQGNVEAFEMIYKTYAGFVYNVAFRFLRHEEDAREVSQEVFWNVYQKLKHFRFESSFKTWIYRITVNHTINYRKKMSRHQAVSYEEHLDRGQVQENSQLNQEDQTKMVDQLLQHLNPEQKLCIILRHIQGLSYEEIAQTLNVNINTVRTRLNRAREKLLTLKEKVNDEFMRKV